VLDVLDDGGRLYRRHFGLWLTMTAGDLAPVWLLALGWGLLIPGQWLLFIVLVTYPALLRTMIRLSQVSALISRNDHEGLNGPQTLRLWHLLSMIGYSLVWSIAPTLLAAAWTSLIERGAHDLIFDVMMPFLNQFVSRQGALLLARLMTHDLYMLTLPTVWLSAHIFAMQPFVSEQKPWHEGGARGNEILLFGFGRSIMLFLTITVLVTALGIGYFGSVLVMFERLTRAPVTLSLLRRPFSGLFPITVWSSLLLLILPQMTLWITLFYRRTAAEFDQADLRQRIAAWHSQSPPATESLLSLER
jgi:hypothetical protein